MLAVELVHACPPVGSALTPCCDRTPFDLPPGDRITTDPVQVTCGAAELPLQRRVADLLRRVGRHDEPRWDVTARQVLAEVADTIVARLGELEAEQVELYQRRTAVGLDHQAREHALRVRAHRRDKAVVRELLLGGEGDGE